MRTKHSIYIIRSKRPSVALLSAVVTFLVFMASCGTPKPTGQTLVTAPDTFAHAGLIDTLSLDGINWKEFFTEPSLRDLIDEALISNFDLRLALTNCELASQALRQANLSWLPDASAGLTASTDPQRVDRFSAGGTLRWEIDIWGKTRQHILAAKADLALSQEEMNMLRTSVVAQTASLYYTIHWLDRQLMILDEQLAINDTLVEMQQTLYRVGKTTSTTVEQSRGQGYTLAIARSNTDKLRENALHVLTALLGKTDMKWGSKQDLEALVIPELAVGVPSNLLANRPDLRAAEQKLHAANAAVGIARRNFYPQLTLTGTGGWSAQSLANLFSNGIFGVVDGALMQPIFNRRQIKTAYEQAKIRKQQSEILFEKTFVQAFAEVDDALLSAARLREQYRLSSQQLAALNRAFADGNALYRGGRITYIELLSLQRDQLDARLRCVELDKEHQLSLIELYRSLGGGE